MMSLNTFSTRSFNTLLILFFTTALTGCQSSNVIVDYDTGTNFSNFKYYELLEERSGGGEDIDPLITERTKTALEAELFNASFSPATAQQPADILVRYYVSSQTRSQESNTRSSVGLGTGGGGTAMGVSLSFPLGGNKIIKEAQIIVDLISPEDKKLKWRGTRNFKLSDETPEEVNAIINAVVAEIFSFYPPDISEK